MTAPGLQKWEGSATLRAGQQSVVNAKVQISQVTEQVTVADDATPLLRTSNATIATTVKRQRIEQLPLDGRSIQTLLSITVPSLESAAAQPRVYGLRNSASARERTFFLHECGRL